MMISIKIGLCWGHTHNIVVLGFFVLMNTSHYQLKVVNNRDSGSFIKGGILNSKKPPIDFLLSRFYDYLMKDDNLLLFSFQYYSPKVLPSAASLKNSLAIFPGNFSVTNKNGEFNLIEHSKKKIPKEIHTIII